MPLWDKKIGQGATVCGGTFDVRRLCVCAMLLGVSMLLSYLEHLLPLDLLVPLPGIRLGWAQIAITVAYFFVGRTEAAMVSGARVILMGLLFGTGMSFCFSVCGALLSYCGLFLGERLYRRCSYFGLGMICAVLHNIGQALAAVLFFGFTVIWSYLPVLLLGAVFTGGIGGILLNTVAARLAHIEQGRG